jgi:mono/diheme cytochrome c family protein
MKLNINVRKIRFVGFWFICLNVVFGAFQNCSPMHESLSSQTSSSLEGHSIEELSQKFSTTLHPVLKANCAGCHGASQEPKFAVDDATAAVTAIRARGLANLNNPEASYFITKIRGGHNGFPESLALQVLAGIESWSQAMNGGQVVTDQTPPAITITAPAASSTQMGLIALTALATDDIGVVGVQFYVDGVEAGGEDTVAPYAASFDSSAIATGQISVTARARDGVGRSTLSAAVLVNINNLAPDTTKPAVVITAPAANANVLGNVNLTATASDNTGVVGVQFFVNGTAVGAEDTAAPYSVVWNASGATVGTHQITARARDAAGNTETSAAISVTNVPPDTINPTVSLTAPAAGASVSGSITVSANASDNSGVVLGVQFLVDGVNTGVEDTTAPYSITLNTASLANGTHAITARARDASGNMATSAARSLTVNNTVSDTVLPTVSLTAPAANATITGTVTVSANASDNAGIAGVQFFVDGVAIGAEDTASPYSVSWNSTAVADGTRALTARARDTSGNLRTSAAVNVSVLNADVTAPTVSITAPAAAATVTGTVSITATAADAVGVVGVQFFVNGAAAGGEDLTSPYSYSWNTSALTNGTYSLTARARDAAGNMRTSTAVSVTVNNVANPNATYTWIAANILTPRCVSCHGASGASAGVQVNNYTNTLRQVRVGNPNSSPLYVETNNGNMPTSGGRLTATQLTAIRDWITAGAPNN